MTKSLVSAAKLLCPLPFMAIFGIFNRMLSLYGHKISIQKGVFRKLALVRTRCVQIANFKIKLFLSAEIVTQVSVPDNRLIYGTSILKTN